MQQTTDKQYIFKITTTVLQAGDIRNRAVRIAKTQLDYGRNNNSQFTVICALN
jgi:hypothetical protein